MCHDYILELIMKLPDILIEVSLDYDFGTLTRNKNISGHDNMEVE